MKHLNGIRTFKATAWKKLAALYAQLTNGQKPFAFVIACSDSRYYAELIMQTEPGELFCLRNAGNMILPYNGDQHPSEGAGTLEYAIDVLKIEHVVVLGHYGCGLVEAALSRPQCVCDLKSLKLWVEQSQHVQVENWNDFDDDTKRQLHRAACRQHVVHQLDNLSTHPCIQNNPNVQKHGLIFDMSVGVVEEYDPESSAFVAIEPAP
ncbi:MAG: carbonic anhydrase [Candidatus Melainabacteria bacterium]|nr:carbonic anhydrase [Candidatus Melainabacteria bacterium]